MYVFYLLMTSGPQFNLEPTVKTENWPSSQATENPHQTGLKIMISWELKIVSNRTSLSDSSPVRAHESTLNSDSLTGQIYWYTISSEIYPRNQNKRTKNLVPPLMYLISCCRLDICFRIRDFKNLWMYKLLVLSTWWEISSLWVGII